MFTRQGFTWIELLTGLLLACIVAGVAIPSYVRMKEKAKESEVKSALHEIQLSVERFAVDTEGSYPPYLIGGSPPTLNQQGPVDDLSDPLLRKGYCQAYPRNPFAVQTPARSQVGMAQASLPSSTIYGNDPLRPGTPDSSVGVRFGVDCSLMGSVLADPRHRAGTRSYLVKGTVKTELLPTYADVEYDYWDMFAPLHKKSFLPGEFFYKGNGPIISLPDEAHGSQQAVLPAQTDSYMLGAYGGLKSAGKDVLGTEPLVHRLKGKKFKWIQAGFSSWTRSQVRGPAAREGSPFSNAEMDDTNEQLNYGNPNGIRDGLVLVVTAGEEYPGDSLPADQTESNRH